MLTDSTHDPDADYEKILADVPEITTMYLECSTIMWAGDVNGSFHRPWPSKNDKYL